MHVYIFIKRLYQVKQIELVDTIVDVKPGPGTGVKVGKSGANKWGNGGGRQWEIQKEERLPEEWFQNQRPLK